MPSRALGIFAALCALSLLTGCGSGHGTSSSSAAASSSPLSGADGNSSTTSSTPTSTSASTSKTFNLEAIRHFGLAASPSQRAAAATNLTRYYAALASGDGATACALLTQKLNSSLAQQLSVSKSPGHARCSAVIATLFNPRNSKAAALTTGLHVTGIRVKGTQGYALFATKVSPEAEIPLALENGAWKIAALIGAAI